MARILFSWELGAGLGHMASFAPFANELRARGHDIVLVVRNPSAVSTVLGMGWKSLQAPIMKEQPRQRFSPTSSYVRLLWNAAWGRPDELAERLQQWRKIFALFSPHLLIADHAPTALLAARGLSFRKIMLGAPFSCPESLGTFGDIYTARDDEDKSEECYVREEINRVLERLGWSLVECLEEIFSVDAVHLTTFPELDVFKRKSAPSFTGSFPISEGARVQWPHGSGKVFAYLKEGPEVELVVKALSRFRIASLVFAGHQSRRKNLRGGETVMISEKPIALQTVAEQCDFAITNATHGTTACLLAAGKPMLMFPRFLEQHLTARKVIALNAGLITRALSLRAVGEGIVQLLREPQYTEDSRRFAFRARPFLAQGRFLSAVAQIERLAAELQKES